MVVTGRFRPALVAVALCSLLGLLSASAATAAPKGFRFGVSSGDVSANSAILWARANASGMALLQIQKRGKWGPCDLSTAPKGYKAKAAKSNDLTVQTRIGGLKPGRTYRYRWCMSHGRHSAAGRFDTAPAPGKAKTIRFAISGDQDAAALPGASTPYWNDFGVWRRVREEGTTSTS